MPLPIVHYIHIRPYRAHNNSGFSQHNTDQKNGKQGSNSRSNRAKILFLNYYSSPVNIGTQNDFVFDNQKDK